MNDLFLNNYENIKCVFCNKEFDKNNFNYGIFILINCCSAKQTFWNDSNNALHIIRFFLEKGIVEITKHNVSIFVYHDNRSNNLQYLRRKIKTLKNVNITPDNVQEIFDKHYNKYMGIKMLM